MLLFQPMHDQGADHLIRGFTHCHMGDKDKAEKLRISHYSLVGTYCVIWRNFAPSTFDSIRTRIIKFL